MRAVQITIEGVREEHIPRLRTVIKTHLVKFGRKLNVHEGEEKPPEPEKAKQPEKKKRGK